MQRGEPKGYGELLVIYSDSKYNYFCRFMVNLLYLKIMKKGTKKEIKSEVKLALVEALKEMGRVVVIAVVPILIDMLTNGEIDYRLLAITGAIAGLRAIDKYIHKTSRTKGLVGF